MQRADYDLPFLLTYENVAWYENGKVRILDRRIYPTEVRFVECTTHQEVAQAITDMVTQSAGPYTAAGMGMALAAYEICGKKEAEQVAYLEKAAHTIAYARPTTANRMGKITSSCLEVGKAALAKGEDPVEAIFLSTVDSLNRRYSIMDKVGKHLIKLMPHNGKILTQCFGETIVGTFLRAAKAENKDLEIFCAETRPYLQGARLTSSCAIDLGFPTTVITDNMVAYAMEYKQIDVFTSAADSIARDGHIANKIGTNQIAIVGQHYEVPYYVTGIPDTDKQTKADIVIEERDPKQVLEYRGIPNTLAGVQAIYPSFDITSPSRISGIVTDKGVYAPNDLDAYFKEEQVRFY
ncbi:MULTISPECIES: S-methyl-5-thioribose-1-phosphate isomerase [Virgibacillus]|uniref:Methylthioribose-1-phosphate isomerase n=1 Tax=Virgibacillus dokdonensis TaxID=302167 RepID=A0A2K9IWY0_9BACI|nr:MULTISPECIES: S-methyl-5-thioribose-1-phosphate isomerase [Virgibacillus]AUJ24268.1 Methylthioribose-1-phosphate isomerase [Virgibacillus dokdonensis]NWO12661.1 S-methyl-5-thioribose-1-phosphate isomerase [Virgibacillus sp.]